MRHSNVTVFGSVDMEEFMLRMAILSTSVFSPADYRINWSVVRSGIVHLAFGPAVDGAILLERMSK